MVQILSHPPTSPSHSTSSSSVPSIPSIIDSAFSGNVLQHNNSNNDQNDEGESTTHTNTNTTTTTQRLMVQGLHILGKTGLLTLESTKLILGNPIVSNITQEFQYALHEYLKVVTPQRMGDVSAIFSSLLKGLASDVILNTELKESEEFRSKLMQFLDSGAGVLTSSRARQLVIDVTCLVLKLAESLHTPEVKVFIQHCSVTVCHVLDLQPSSPCKHFLNDVTDLAWAGITLMASDETSIALAEICANTVHFMEMEDVVHRRTHEHRNGKEGMNDVKEERTEKRRERSHKVTQAHGNETSHCNDNRGVEEAFLSSLGAVNLDDTTSGAMPGDVFEGICHLETMSNSSICGETIETKEGSRLRPQKGVDKNNLQKKDATKFEIDVNYLRRKMLERKENLEEISRKYRSERQISDRFSIHLDERLSIKRNAAIERLTADDDQFYSNAAAAAGADNEYGQETLKAKASKAVSGNSTSRIGVGGNRNRVEQANLYAKSTLIKYLAYILGAIFILAVICFTLLFWILMALYGFYVFFLNPVDGIFHNTIKNIAGGLLNSTSSIGEATTYVMDVGEL
eukprot:CAMPEP_0116056950 /NCGR_PEP_ID=MMETSP0322-20121206/4321_1 /TAXON_ID=163516 /ORGANISM="Leptocylindrus danicus var. apora, Strain B651" /LENGTH=570 /DNA_ID=CAMNT_0003540869 /DNA_START=24 /DNA_END=1736 /DNA_ORIENTATION=+